MDEIDDVPAQNIILPEFLQLSDLQGFADHFSIYAQYFNATTWTSAESNTTPIAQFDAKAYRRNFIVRSFCPAVIRAGSSL